MHISLCVKILMSANPTSTNVMMTHSVETPEDRITVRAIAAMKAMDLIVPVCLPKLTNQVLA